MLPEVVCALTSGAFARQTSTTATFRGDLRFIYDGDSVLLPNEGAQYFCGMRSFWAHAVEGATTMATVGMDKWLERMDN